jgi:hypothetical protein
MIKAASLFSQLLHHYLLSYRMIDEDIEHIMIGPNENYYRGLTAYSQKG